MEACVGEAHQPTYTVSVQVKRKKVFGKGSSKKNAEKDAAKKMLEELKNGYCTWNYFYQSDLIT